MPFSVWARGDSGTANNASLNVESTNQQPTTLLTFEATPGGDEVLDFNKGAGTVDDDTVVYLGSDPTPYTFVVHFGGFLPQTNKLANVNGVDLRGLEIRVLTIEETGDRFFFIVGSDGSTTWFDIMNVFPNGAHAITGLFACYTAGTLIATPDGARAVETLAPGDLVTTADGRAVPVRLSVSRTLPGRDAALFPALRPYTIPAGSLGPSVPARDLTVSALHRILIRDPGLGPLFGFDAAFVAARDLPMARPSDAAAPLTYVHLLCDDHECLIANGAESESLLAGDVALASVGPDERARITALIGTRPVRAAYPCLTSQEAAVWRKTRDRTTAAA